MADEVRDIVHTPKQYSTEVAAIAALGTGRWGFAQNTRRFIINDASTFRYFWDSTRQADTTGDDVAGMTYGLGLQGCAGITGVTPRGGSSGSVGTAYDMLVGLRDYASGTFVDGSGTAGTLPIWSDSDTIGDSIITYVNGVFDVIYPTAGSGPQWRVKSSSDTSNAYAQISVGVAGAASTGDASFATALAGTNNYIWGYDVSATKYVFSAGSALGTGNIFTADGTTFTVVDIANFDAAVSMDTTLVVTGTATFNQSSLAANTSAIWLSSATPFLTWNESDAAADAKIWNFSVNSSEFRGRIYSDDVGTNASWLSVVRSTTAISSISFGNATNNNTFTVLGTGLATFGGNVIVTRSSSGGTVLSSITNSSNSASAYTIFRATAAGTTASGVGHEIVVTGGTTFSLWINPGTGYLHLSGAGIGGGNDMITMKASTSYTSIGTTNAVNPTAILDVVANGLGTSLSNATGLFLTNRTAAAAGAQQYSPTFTQRGSGWKTDATAATQTVDFQRHVVTVQGAAAPTGYLIYRYQINDGGYTEAFRINTAATVVFVSEIVTAASSTTRSGFNLPAGTAPSSPVTGDMWFDGTAATGLKFYDGVTTKTVTLV